MIKILNSSQKGFENEFDKILSRGNEDISEVTPKVEFILREVRENGLSALLSQVERFDRWSPKSLQDLSISPSECKEAYDALDKDTKDALHIAYDRIYAFHSKEKRQSWLDFEANGSVLGAKYTPVERAGLYIPGGKASYPSSLLMNAIPAIVAGVESIFVCTPTPDRQTNALLLAALHICGIKEIYKVGGASAVGLMAFGVPKSQANPQIKKADVITGPGNIYVATAKKLVFGEVGIDMIAGPSEIAIIADSSANATYLAHDLLSQAEHDEMASSFLFVDDENLAKIVAQKVEAILDTLPKKHIAKSSIDNRGAIIICKDIAQCTHYCNALAPEHLELMVASPFELLPSVKNAGAIFLGSHTPEPIGDYLAGPNHTLPTGGSARFFSPLGVEHFMKKSSVIYFSKGAISTFGKPCAHLAHLEDLDAHAQAVLARMQQTKS